MPTLYTSLSNIAYTTLTGQKRIVAFITGPQGIPGIAGTGGGGTGSAFDPSGYITTGQADLRYYPLTSNPSGYIQNSGFLTGFNSGNYINRSETGQFYPASNPFGYANSGDVAATGQQAIIFANNNASNISGDLAQTGSILIARDLSISGVLNLSINSLSGFVTGSSGSLQTQINNLATSSNLALTGSNLFALITGASGQAVIDYATKTNLASTGQQAWGAAQNNALNLSGNLTLTGQTLVNSINSLSGFTTGVSGFLRTLIQGSAGGVNSVNGQSGILNISGLGNISVTTGANTIFVSGDTGAYGNFATVANLSATGSTLSALITGLSGQAIADYATKANLALTGQQSWSAANNNALNLSGNLTQTGVSLGNQINSLSGFTTGVSGFLRGLIQGSAGGVSSLNGQSGIIDIVGAGNISVTTGLNTIIVSGNTGAYANFATSISLTQTGVTLGAQINSLSGFSTGFSGALQSQINSLPTAANLALTGSNLFVIITGLSGQANINYATNTNLALTGSNLFVNLTGLSGAFNSQIANTCSQAWSAANNNALNLSGNLTQTGSALLARDFLTSGVLATGIAATGTAAISYTNSVGILISGNLALTGSQAWSAANNNGINLSGNLTQTGVALIARDLAISGALQAQIGAGGAQVKVTGSASISIADFTGIGTTLVFTSGGQIFISGAPAGAGAGDVTQAQLNSLSGWTATNLTQTGVNLLARDLLISGVLSTGIAVTGNAAVNYTNSVGTIISGDLSTKQKIITYGTGIPTGGIDGDIYLQYV